jgi:hypothetical protein
VDVANIVSILPSLPCDPTIAKDPRRTPAKASLQEVSDRPDIVSLLHLCRVPLLPQEEQLVEKQHTPEEVAVVFPYGAQGAAHTQRVDAAEGNSYLRRNNCSSFPI